MKRLISGFLMLSLSCPILPAFADGLLSSNEENSIAAKYGGMIHPDTIDTLQILPTGTHAKKEITVPSFTNIPLIVKQPISGNALHKGDVIPVEVNNDVKINNVLVFKRGQEATLFVEKSKRHGIGGKGGIILIQNGTINDAFGNNYSLSVSKEIKGDRNWSGTILPLVSLVFLWPLAFTIFIKGEDAIIPAGTMLTGTTTSNQVLSLNY